MVYELESVRVGDQGITCNSGCGLVGTGETSVNDEELTAALDRGFTLFLLDRNMTVDNMSHIRRKVELLKNLIHDGLIVVQAIVRSLRLFMCSLILDEITLEGGHTLLAEERRSFIRPQEIDQVGRIALLISRGQVIALTHIVIHNIHQLTALVGLPFQLDTAEGAILIQRDGAVEEECIVIY